jgi:hypothetical protein
MNTKPLRIDLKLTRLGWCLFVDGEPYAIGMQAYCIRVAAIVRRDFAIHGRAAFPDLAAKGRDLVQSETARRGVSHV